MKISQTKWESCKSQEYSRRCVRRGAFETKSHDRNGSKKWTKIATVWTPVAIFLRSVTFTSTSATETITSIPGHLRYDLYSHPEDDWWTLHKPFFVHFSGRADGADTNFEPKDRAALRKSFWMVKLNFKTSQVCAQCLASTLQEVNNVNLFDFRNI